MECIYKQADKNAATAIVIVAISLYYTSIGGISRDDLSVQIVV